MSCSSESIGSESSGSEGSGSEWSGSEDGGDVTLSVPFIIEWLAVLLAREQAKAKEDTLEKFWKKTSPKDIFTAATRGIEGQPPTLEEVKALFDAYYFTKLYAEEGSVDWLDGELDSIDCRSDLSGIGKLIERLGGQTLAIELLKQLDSSS